MSALQLNFLDVNCANVIGVVGDYRHDRLAQDYENTATAFTRALPHDQEVLFQNTKRFTSS